MVPSQSELAFPQPEMKLCMSIPFLKLMNKLKKADSTELYFFGTTSYNITGSKTLL